MPSSLIESPWVIDDLTKQIEIEIAIWECKRKLEQDLSLSVCVITSIVQARSVLLQSVCAASQIMDPTRYSLCKLRTVIEVVCVCGCAHCVMSNWGINSPPQTVDAFLPTLWHHDELFIIKIVMSKQEIIKSLPQTVLRCHISYFVVLMSYWSLKCDVKTRTVFNRQ